MKKLLKNPKRISNYPTQHNKRITLTNRRCCRLIYLNPPHWVACPINRKKPSSCPRTNVSQTSRTIVETVVHQTKTSMDNDKFTIPNSAGLKWLNIKLEEIQNDSLEGTSKSCNVDHRYDGGVVLDVEGIH